jgi:hypothetical protein
MDDSKDEEPRGGSVRALLTSAQPPPPPPFLSCSPLAWPEYETCGRRTWRARCATSAPSLTATRTSPWFVLLAASAIRAADRSTCRRTPSSLAWSRGLSARSSHSRIITTRRCAATSTCSRSSRSASRSQTSMGTPQKTSAPGSSTSISTSSQCVPRRPRRTSVVLMLSAQ